MRRLQVDAVYDLMQNAGEYPACLRSAPGDPRIKQLKADYPSVDILAGPATSVREARRLVEEPFLLKHGLEQSLHAWPVLA